MRRTILVTALAVPALAFATAPAAVAEPGDCVIDEVSAVTGVDPRSSGEVEGVRVLIEGTVPADIGATVSSTVAGAMTQTGPIRTMVEPAATGAVVTVRGVAGDLPPELDDALATATGCLAADDPAADEAPADDPSPGCEVERVQTIDVEGEATSTVAEIEGAVVEITGPLPVGAASTVGIVFAEAGAVNANPPVDVETTVEGAILTVTGVTGPLPAELPAEIADALGCDDATAEPAPADDRDPAPDGDGNEPTDTDTDESDESEAEARASAEADVEAGAAVPSSDATFAAAAEPQATLSGRGTLPRTGSNDALALAGGTILAAVAGAVRCLLKKV